MFVAPAKCCTRLIDNSPLRSNFSEQLNVILKTLCRAKRLTASNAEALHGLSAPADSFLFPGVVSPV